MCLVQRGICSLDRRSTFGIPITIEFLEREGIIVGKPTCRRDRVSPGPKFTVVITCNTKDRKYHQPPYKEAALNDCVRSRLHVCLCEIVVCSREIGMIELQSSLSAIQIRITWSFLSNLYPLLNETCNGELERSSYIIRKSEID